MAQSDGARPEPASSPRRRSIEHWWWDLPPVTQQWLVDHNGEHLPADVVDKVASAAGGVDPSWWAGGDDEDCCQLTDAACDRIDEAADGEWPEPRAR